MTNEMTEKLDGTTLADQLNIGKDPPPHQSSTSGITSSTKFPFLNSNSPTAISQYSRSFDAAVESMEIMNSTTGRTFEPLSDKNMIRLFAGGITVEEMVDWYLESKEEYCEMKFKAFVQLWSS